MPFKINDYVKHVEYPKSKVPMHLTQEMQVDVVNAQSENFEYASQEERDRYWEDEK